MDCPLKVEHSEKITDFFGRGLISGSIKSNKELVGNWI